MLLDRNIPENEGRGKYAIIKLRALALCIEQSAFGGLHPPVAKAIEVLEKAGVLDWGIDQTSSEFFLIRLKDAYAQAALRAYADAARGDDPEYAAEIDALAQRSGPAHPNCQKPD
jgi:hypothetical protein